MDIQNYPEVLSPPLKKGKKKTGGFQSMFLKHPIFRAIKAKGYNLPTPIQRKVIPLAIEGRDVVACSRTGSGKTAAFLIPLLNKLEKHSNIIGARALILSPTRELALQTSSMNKSLSKFTDLVSCVIVGGHGFEGQFESLASNPDIIIATPGRLAQVLNETNLTLRKLEFLVFDEADFLFEMGFAQHINTIIEKVNANRQTLLFSATIPEELSEFSRAKLKDYVFCKLDSEYSLSDEIQLNFLLCRSQEKIPVLLYLLLSIIKSQQTTIIFVSTKFHVDLLTVILQEFGIYNVGIYGKMDQLARKENLNLFRSNKVRVLVVTDLAARGLDIPFVNNVIHYDYPAKPKIFIHRSGRTARAGRSGCVYSLIKMEETMYLTEIALYIGRKLTCDKKDLYSNNKAVYGRVPEEVLNPFMEAMEKIKRNQDYFKEFDVSEKAFKQFLKTRKKASRASLENSKLMDFNTINPLFDENEEGDSKAAKKMILDIKNFKPKSAYLELTKIKQVKNGGEKDSFLKIVNNMKKIEQKNHEKHELEKQKEEFPSDNDENPLENTAIHEKKENNGVRLNKRRMNQITGDNIEKKQKKSDFKHPTQFISAEQDMHQKKADAFDISNKISSEDVNPFLLAENFEDLAKAKKHQTLWDKKKKKYVKGTLTETGDLKKDKEDKLMHKDHGKKLYKNWSKKNRITFQSEGEFEDTNITNRAKNLFQNRRNNRFFTEKNPAEFEKSTNKPGKKELKTPNQIYKERVKKNKMNLKNMDKTKRRQILHRKK